MTNDTTYARQALAKVPEITVVFWALKLLTTGMGEAMSDFLGQTFLPAAVIIGPFGFALAMWLQLRHDRYSAPTYWFAVMMVAVFGTMVADGIHIVGISYFVTTPLFAAATAAVFYRWHKQEGTLSIHSIVNARREKYYWLAVLSTFALGTAAGDLTAYSLHLGFWTSVLLFGALIAIPAISWWRFDLNPVIAFWFAYVITRPLGASFADGFSKPTSQGLNLGDGTVAGIALIVFVALVSWVTVKKIDVQPPHELAPHPHPHPHGQHPHAAPRLGLETE